MNGMDGSAVDKLLNDFLPALGPEDDPASLSKLGNAGNGAVYYAYVSYKDSLIIGKGFTGADGRLSRLTRIDASELGGIIGMLKAIGVDVPSRLRATLSEQLSSQPKPILHAAASGEAKAFRNGTNIKLGLDGMDGMDGSAVDKLLNDFLPALGPEDDPASLSKLGNAGNGAVYYAYAGYEGSLIIGKGFAGADGRLSRLTRIDASELGGIIGMLKAISVDVPSRLRATLSEQLSSQPKPILHAAS